MVKQTVYQKRLADYRIVSRVLSQIPVLHNLRSADNVTVHDWSLEFLTRQGTAILRYIGDQKNKEEKNKIIPLAHVYGLSPERIHLAQRLSMMVTLKQYPHAPLIFRREASHLYGFEEPDSKEITPTGEVKTFLYREQLAPTAFAHWAEKPHDITEWYSFFFQYLIGVLVHQRVLKKGIRHWKYHEIRVLPEEDHEKIKGYSEYRIISEKEPPMTFYPPQTRNHFIFEFEQLTDAEHCNAVLILTRVPDHLRFLNIYLTYTLDELLKKIKRELDETEFNKYYNVLKNRTKEPARIKEGVVDYLLRHPELNIGYQEQFILPPEEILLFLKQLPLDLPIETLLLQEFDSFQLKPSGKLNDSFLLNLNR